MLGDGERILATAAPAGPAFEGGAIKCGMRAADGAIEVVKISDDDVSCQVIGDGEAYGLCGSGLVDAVAELVKVGLIDSSGRYVTNEVAATVAPGWPTASARSTVSGCSRCPGGPAMRVTSSESVFLSQRDIRELQFAKAAISTGWTLLLEELGVDPTDVQQVLLAGSFGSYLSPASAVRIGLVPKLPVLRIVSAGNVAGEGAKMVLLSMQERKGALALLEEVRYVELSDRADFNDTVRRPARFPWLTIDLPSRRSSGRRHRLRCDRAAGLPDRRLSGLLAIDVYPLPPLLHNHPELIAGEVERARNPSAAALRPGR